MASDTVSLITKCANNLLSTKGCLLSELGTASNLSKLIGKLTNKNVSEEEEIVCKEILNFIKDYYLTDEIINIKEVLSFNEREIAKLYLISLNIGLMNSEHLQKNFLVSMNLSTPEEMKLKYLFENLQKKGQGLCKTYLDILLEESSDLQQFERKDLKEYKSKYEELKLHCETIEVKNLSEVDEEKKIVTKLKKEIKNLKEENSSLNETLKQTVNENIETTSKFDSLKKKNNLAEDERKRLSEENSKLKELSAHYKSLLESQNVELSEMKTQLQELECHLKNMQCTRMKRIMSAAEESYEGHPISMDLSESKDNSDSSIEMENRASCIVDKILEDTKYQLECSESQNKTLVQDISFLTETKNELTIQVDDLNRKLQESKSLSKDLQCNIQEIRKEKQILEIEMQKLEELLKIKDEKLNGLSKDFESLSNEKLQEKDNFENLLSSAEDEKKKLELHIEELENVRKDEKLRLESYTKEVENKMKVEVAELNSLLENETTLKLEFEKKLKDIKESLSLKEKEKLELENQKKILTRDLEDIKVHLNEKENFIQEKVTIIRELQDSKQMLESKVEDILKCKENDRLLNEKQNGELEQQRLLEKQNFEAILNEKEIKISSCENKCKEKNSEIQILIAEKEREKKTFLDIIQEKEKILHENEKEKLELQIVLKKMEDEKLEIENALNEMKTEKDNVKTELETFETQTKSEKLALESELKQIICTKEETEQKMASLIKERELEVKNFTDEIRCGKQKN
ncbi:hypothetical protein Anas_00300 [Armadillidium nasatum]|uniref:Uncharacterized protein n=1 Tax=Armadillidium nasatum TaxID=96803 RepID=A0A5N5TG78_9CRUS|nr:hypothetical protein Anas_00300 [Armadillidium nasatum]